MDKLTRSKSRENLEDRERETDHGDSATVTAQPETSKEEVPLNLNTLTAILTNLTQKIESMETNTLLSLGRSNLNETVKCGPIPQRDSEGKLCYINNIAGTCPSSYVLGTTVVKRCLLGHIKDYRQNITYVCDTNGWKAEYYCEDCGLQTEEDNYPWVVAISNSDNKLICSGTIISDIYILTAAQCFKYNDKHEMLDPSNYTIIAGKHRPTCRFCWRIYPLQKRKIHLSKLDPGYLKDSRSSNIILLKTDTPFLLGKNVGVVCIDWYSVYEESDFKDVNKKTEWYCQIEIIYPRKEKCRQTNANRIYSQYILCDNFIGHPTCDKKLGSGTFFKSSQGRYFLRGIASVIDPGYYMWYTKSTYYLSWVGEHVSVYDCVLPDHIKYGRFRLSEFNKTYIKDKLVPPMSVMSLYCTVEDHLRPLFRCEYGQWHPSIAEASCREPVKCSPAPQGEHEEKECYINNAPVACNSSFNFGENVVKKCVPAYTRDNWKNVTYVCHSYSWRPKYGCVADCGSQTGKSKYPWAVAIYNSDEELTCTGTILSENYVLTAAECFDYNKKNEMLDKLSYTMVAGEHYINLNRNKSSSQKRKIRTFELQPHYIRYSANIIILETDKAFILNDYVRPACIDWESHYEEWDFKDGNEAIALSWDFVKADAIPCKSNAQFWQRNTCMKNLPPSFPYSFFEEDKFCAELFGDSTCDKDLGSGIFFKSTGRRYFLRGIAVKVDDNSNYIMYMKLSNYDYLDWLGKHLNRGRILDYPMERVDNGCILPDHIKYGRFSLTTGSIYPKGRWVPTMTTILLFCNGKGGNYSVLSFRCTNKEWHPSIPEDTCRKPGTCPPIKASASQEVVCKLNGRVVSCEDAQSNTTLVIRCQSFFTFPGYRPTYKCQDGDWDQVVTPCVPECGIKRIDATTLTVGGIEAQQNEYPWVVSIYNSKSILICGGTIISRKFVLTAAHCFKNSQRILANKSDYTIIAGKHYRDINIQEHLSQTSKIKSLLIHEEYKGLLRNHRDDIALIELETEFIPSLNVEPVCVDWDDAYEDFDLVDGSEGVVAGWGYTQESGSPSDVLKKIIVPFRPKNICLQYLPRNFSDKYVTEDKICAGNINNGTNVCMGDSGGGLYFKSDRTRYFIRGIVSLTVKSTVGCDVNHYALYTKVSKYLPWIESITRKLL